MKTFVNTPLKPVKLAVAQGMTIFFIASTFYSYGTAMMDYFLVYPSRAIIGEAEFVTYHLHLDRYIMPISVYPFVLLTLFNIGLFWFRLPDIPIKLVYASFACLLIDWLSTLLVQIPMNLELNEGKNLELIEKVMQTNWIRVAMESIQALIAFIMLWRLISGNYSLKNKE